MEQVIDNICKEVFSKSPEKVEKIKLYEESDIKDETVTDIYEALIKIIIRGYDIIKGSEFNLEDFVDINRWTRRIGYKYTVKRVKKEEVEDYYNKIIFKSDKSWENFFMDTPGDIMIIKGTHSPYNKNMKCTLNNLYTIIDYNFSEEYYKIEIKLL